MSVNLNLNRIPIQSDVQSIPLDENFIDIENGVNDIQAQIDALLTPPAGSEVTNARDYHDVLRDRLRSASAIYPKYLISGGDVTADDPGVTFLINIAAGEAIVDGVACKWNATSKLLVGASTQKRWDTVVINSDNTISVVQGLEAASPVLPTVAASQKKLAHCYINAGYYIGAAESPIVTCKYEPPAGYIQGQPPVGSIQAWHKSLTGTPTLEEWWLECNGQVCSDPESPYYGETLPDLNGDERFLRGGATSGTEQDCQNLQHNHGVTQSGHAHGINESAHTHTLTDSGHDHGGATSTESATHSHAGSNVLSDEVLDKSTAGYYNWNYITADPPGDDYSPKRLSDVTTGANNATHTHSISSGTTGITISSDKTNIGTQDQNANVTIDDDPVTPVDTDESRPINMSVVWIIRIK